ncbi:hypothetical protein ACIQOU_20210 [Streptomyces sp. NPDC091279]|uniref:hypothetical protein n=1 Tax=Streptomyces sp. NPDC091279 TaxID=3365983 RepID=UPI00381A802B
MIRRPVAWTVAVVLGVEAFAVGALNWLLGVVADRQHMSLARVDPALMVRSTQIAAIVFGLYFALCALVALLVAVRDREPAGLGRALLISAAVVHGMLGAFGWGLVGWTTFLYMVVVLALIVLLLVSYDAPADRRAEGGPGEGPHEGPGAAPVTPPAAPTAP